ncbi:MAG TPA: hypothetical protein VNG13_15110 [Mycobacteriales bacterium]|nr:hypothetical protein [Mycobacteriales bacterium]
MRDFESKRPKLDEAGVPLYAVGLVALADGGAEVLSVKLSGEPANLTQGLPVRVSGLVANPWTMGDRSGVAFKAARIEPATGSASKPASQAG